MQSWLKDIKGMWVATYTEGSMLGTVNNIYLDPQAKQITGLVLRTGTPLSGADRWVAVKDIKKIGVDLIFLPNEDALGTQEPEGQKVAQLLGMPVSTKDGRSLGTLADIEVDLDNWQVTQLALSNNLSVAVDLNETVLGHDLILLQAGAEPDALTRARNKENLVASVLGKDFMKQTSDALKRVLKGSEANLSKPSPDQNPQDPKPE